MISLTESNYYSREADKLYMSVSQFKDFQKCEAAAMAKLAGAWKPESTTALLVGSYVDAHFDGTLDLFRAQHPEIYTLKGELRADYKKAEEIIQRADNDEMFSLFMAGRKQVIMTGELFGVPWKIKIDSLLGPEAVSKINERFPNVAITTSEAIVDLKCMRSLERVMGVSFVEHWQYDLQLAVYAAIRGEGPETFIAAITKEEVPDMAVIHIPDWRREECLKVVERELPHIMDVKEGRVPAVGCGVCDYCKTVKALNAITDFEDVGFSNYEIQRMKGVY